jgi:replicative DNA helicase
VVQALESASRRAAGRVPPHNLEAEESLLGAMLLSRDAISAAAEANVDTTDFYKPAHAHIFDAILALYGQGEPVDPVTVADELRRAELLDNLGGRQALLRLQASTPASANAAHYAKIVNELALLRRLIAVAGDIAEMGYDDSGEVMETLDRAESLVFEVADRRVVDSTTVVANALQETLDELEARYGSTDDIVGSATGYVDLDRQLMGLQPSTLVVLAARPAMGKALALPTPIPTPSGWTTMADLRPGDHVLDDQGNPTLVTYASPVFRDRECFEVAFDDGSTLLADAEHQWLAYDNSAWRALRESGIQRPRVVTTAQMIAEGVRRHDRPNWYLPLVSLDLPEADLRVDPYVLGCWLGDGSSRGSSLTIGEQDADHFRGEFTDAGYRLVHRPGHDPLSYATTPVDGTGKWQGYCGPIRVLARELQEVGLLRGATKHIPAQYLRSSFKQRLALLQGLMDTDGCVTNGNGTAELCLANRGLLEQAHELVCSLGHKAGAIRRKEISLDDGRTAVAWRFRWSPLDDVFRLPRKSARLAATVSQRRHGRHTRRAITSIRPVATEPVKCIAVESANHVYLAGRTMIPTHNTALALGLAKGVAGNARRPVMFFSMEMGTLELTKRLLAAEAKVKASKLWTANLTEGEWGNLSHAVGRLAELPLLIDDNPHCTVMEMRAKARRAKARYGDLGLVVVDYIQLMTPSTPGGRRAENRQVEVAEISRGLKILARELECPVLALSQLNRQLEYRQDKRPMLADLRESGGLEQDADVVMFIYREEVYSGIDTPDADKGKAEVIVAKHRNGPTGTVELTFIPDRAEFANMARDT